MEIIEIKESVEKCLERLEVKLQANTFQLHVLFHEFIDAREPKLSHRFN